LADQRRRLGREALAERDALYAKPDMSNEDGMRLGELEGIVGDASRIIEQLASL